MLRIIHADPNYPFSTLFSDEYSFRSNSIVKRYNNTDELQILTGLGMLITNLFGNLTYGEGLLVIMLLDHNFLVEIYMTKCIYSFFKMDFKIWLITLYL